MKENKLLQQSSNRQILIATLLGGPLSAVLMISRNYFISKNRNYGQLTRFTGVILTLFVLFFSRWLVTRFFLPSGELDGLEFQKFSYTLLSIFLMQILFAGFYGLFCRYLQRSICQGNNAESIWTFSFFSVLLYILLGLTVTGYFLLTGPFGFIFTLIYLLPNLYLYNHIKKIFSKGRQQTIFSLFFVLLVLLFPLGEMLEHSGARGVAGFSLFAGYYYLPFLLYMFLLYLLLDLVKFMLNRLKVVKSAYFTKKKLHCVIFGIFFLLTSGIVGTGIYHFNHTRVTPYRIEVTSQEGNLENLVIAMAADFHFSQRTQKNFVRQFVRKLNAIHPDIILFPGDIIESLPSDPKMQFIQQQLNQLDATYGVYAAEGNHELYGDNGKLKFFDNTNLTMLKDTVIKIENAFYLVGRKDRQNGRRKSLDELMGQTNEDIPLIVLDHQPYHLEQVATKNVDVQVSGHTHHGQLFPFHWITQAMYRLSWGYEKIRDTHFFVTCGAQGWGPPVKTSSYSEIMQITVSFKQ